MNNLPRNDLSRQCQCGNILFESRNGLFMANRKGKREGEKQNDSNQSNVTDAMRTDCHTRSQHPIRHPFAVGDVHWVQHLNKHR